MSYIVFSVDFIFVLFASYLILKNTSLTESKSEFMLSVFVLSAANIILSTIILSELRSITPVSYAVIHLLILLASLGVQGKSRKQKKAVPHYTLKQSIHSIFSNAKEVPQEISLKYILKTAFGEHPLLASLAVFACITVLTEFIIAIHFVPNNWDSLTYHLSRVGYWSQNETLRHFFTVNPRQNIYPINGEVLLLWVYASLKSDTGFGLLQWFVGILSSILVFKTSQLISMNKRQALCSALIYITLPLIVLESSTTQNDMLVAFFVFCSVYFLMSGLKKASNEHILISSISAGIAFGTKPTFFLAVTGVAISVIYYYLSAYKKNRGKFLHYENDKKLIPRWMLYSFGFILLLGMYNYALNFVGTKNLFGGKSAYAISQYSLDGFIANISRVLYRFIDMSGWPNALIPHSLFNFVGKVCKALFDLFDIKYNMPAATEPVLPFKFAINHRCNTDFSYFGPIGFMVIIPTFFSNLLKLFKNKKGVHPFKAWLVIIPAFILVSFSILLKYNEWNGRFFIMFATLLSPLYGYVYYSGKNIWKNVYKIAVICIIPITVIISLKENEHKPLPWGLMDSKLEMRCKTRPEIHVIFKFIEDNVEANRNIGLIICGDDYDFLLFNGKRKVFQVKDIKSMQNKEIDLILARKALLKQKLPTNKWVYQEINKEWVLLHRVSKV